MLFQSSAILLFAVFVHAVPSPHPAPSSAPANPDVQPRVCGTGPPSDELRQIHDTLYTQARNAKLSKRALPVFNHVTVETYFHFVTTFDQAPKYSPDMRNTLASNQAFMLNTAYKDTNISFHMQKPTYTINDNWATDASSSAMKSALRKGGYAALNIYFQSNLSSAASGSTPGQTLLGYCTLPQSVIYNPPCSTTPCPSPIPYPPSAWAQDGCNVLLGTMPQGGVAGYQMGKTAVHEVGHWFGLLHTFQDNTCTAGDSGDFIDDTRQESVATTGCPAGKNSCPGLAVPGEDPISNFMDYSTDECYTSFTPDQHLRMQGMWTSLRQGN